MLGACSLKLTLLGPEGRVVFRMVIGHLMLVRRWPMIEDPGTYAANFFNVCRN